MSPDDPRHGTTAGHQAHRKDGEVACQPCIAAKTRYEKVRHVYGDRMVPALGTRRRVQALKALGHSGADIAARLGVTYQAVHKIEHGQSERVFAATAQAVARVFSEMSMSQPTGMQAKRTRNQAVRRGYAPPLAWDDIDNPSDRPSGSALARVAVLRERSWDTSDHAACERCGIVRQLNRSIARGATDLCRDCLDVERVSA